MIINQFSERSVCTRLAYHLENIIKRNDYKTFFMATLPMLNKIEWMEIPNILEVQKKGMFVICLFIAEGKKAGQSVSFRDESTQ